MVESATSERIVIVGGGFAGLAIATRLAQAGQPVTLLEASELGHEASTRNQGWLHSGAWFADIHPELAKACYASLQKAVEFCPECLEREHEGMIYLTSDPSSLPATYTTAWRAASIPFRELTPAEARAALPEFDPERICHAWELPDRAFQPEVLLIHLAAAARNAGAEVLTGQHVKGLERDGETIQAVVTDSGETFRARIVILATGALGKDLWLEYMQPRSGEQSDYSRVVLKTHLAAIRANMQCAPFCVLDEGGFNHIPHHSTSVFGTNHWITVNDPWDTSVDPQEEEAIWRTLRKLAPTFAPDPGTQRHVWAGTTVQAMHLEQVEPGVAPLPTVVDHSHESPRITNLLSVYPGRATLFGELAEQARELVLEKIDGRALPVAHPPWSNLDSEDA